MDVAIFWEFPSSRQVTSMRGLALTPESEPALRTVLVELRRDTALKLLVKAFADAREANGVELSLARARLAVDWLVRRRMSREHLRPLGRPHRTGTRGEPEGRTCSDLEVGGL